jgi:hypothetical protein
MWRKTSQVADLRSPQAFAGIPTDTRELARLGKKKPQPFSVGVSILVAMRGNEPSFGRVRKDEEICGITKAFAGVYLTNPFPTLLFSSWIY